MNDSELQDQLAAAHVQAWRWALLCAGRQHDLAQDGLQNSYLAILDGSARFAGHASFQTFLFAVIRRQIQRLQRRSWLDLLRPQRVLAQLSENAACFRDAHLEQSLDAARLWHALASLPPRQREVLALVFGHDMPIAQAATVLDLRLGTARTHYARGKAALRASLGLALEQEQP
jgi:RNA polymerase sigma-70 factor (ECF subfamily)